MVCNRNSILDRIRENNYPWIRNLKLHVCSISICFDHYHTMIRIQENVFILFLYLRVWRYTYLQMIWDIWNILKQIDFYSQFKNNALQCYSQFTLFLATISIILSSCQYYHGEFNICFSLPPAKHISPFLVYTT